MKEIKSRWSKRDLAKKQRKARLAMSASSDPDMYRGDRSVAVLFLTRFSKMNLSTL